MEQQGSKEWFEKRKGKVTGSVVGAILGLNPYMTKDDVMRQMVRDYHDAEPEFKGNIFTEYGSENEENACNEFEYQTELETQETGFHVHHDLHWLGASPDRLVGDNAILEIKCPYSKRNSNEFQSINELPQYYSQVQFEMFCSNREKAYFFQWSQKGSKLEIVNINRDWISEALIHLEAFYVEFLEQVNNPEYLELLVGEYEDEELKKELDEAERGFKIFEEKLKIAKKKCFDIADGKKMRICGRLVYPVLRQGQVNYKKIVQAFCPDVDLEEFRGKPSEYMAMKCDV